MTASRRRAQAKPRTPEATHAPGEQLAALRAQAAQCTACPLYEHATQTVFGEGPSDARLVLVGEVPGDHEDREGHPFVGPAGKLLRRTLEVVDVPIDDVYLTNAVKHFKFTQRGKRRLHKKPDRTEMVACRPWLEAELEVVDPQVVVALGAVAAASLLDRNVAIGPLRGQPVPWAGPGVLIVTVHPAAVIRTERGAPYDAAFTSFVGDLRLAKDQLRP